jgi:hypothetical protein
VGRTRSILHIKFWSENRKEETLEDIGVDGSIILKYILNNRWECVNWIHLAQGG